MIVAIYTHLPLVNADLTFGLRVRGEYGTEGTILARLHTLYRYCCIIYVCVCSRIDLKGVE